MDEMKPGREMDAKIATEVLGWTDLEWKKLDYSPETQLVGVKPGERASPYTGYKPKHSVPKYSTDIAAAMDVLNKAFPKPGFRHCLAYDGEDVVFSQLEEGSLNPGRQLALGKSWEHAICLAALKAVGAD